MIGRKPGSEMRNVIWFYLCGELETTAQDGGSCPFLSVTVSKLDVFQEILFLIPLSFVCL